MSEYTIKDLEKISGIKAHTIRIWEKRYGLIEPKRLDNNRRVYSENELKKFMKISALYNMGHKPSKIKTMPSEEMERVLSQDTENLTIDEIIRLTQAGEFHKASTLIRNIINGHDLEHNYFQFILPLLNQIGNLWSIDQLNIAHEHFISNCIKSALTYRENLAQPDHQHPNYQKKVVLFLPEDELHDIPLLFTHTALKERNYNSIYLGGDIPNKSLHELKSIQPDALVTFFVKFRNSNYHNDYLLGLHKIFDDTPIFHNIHTPSGDVRAIRSIRQLDSLRTLDICLM